MPRHHHAEFREHHDNRRRSTFKIGLTLNVEQKRALCEICDELRLKARGMRRWAYTEGYLRGLGLLDAEQPVFTTERYRQKQHEGWKDGSEAGNLGAVTKQRFQLMLAGVGLRVPNGKVFRISPRRPRRYREK